MSAQQFITDLPLAFMGLAMVISWNSFRRGYPAVLRELSLLCTFAFAIDLAGHVMIFHSIQNTALYNAYLPVWFLLLADIYRRLLTGEIFRKLTLVFFIAFPLFVIVNTLWGQGIFKMQTYTFIAGSCFVALLVVAYFRQLYLSESSEKLRADPFFWLSAGLVILLAGQTPFIGMVNYLVRNYPDFSRIYYLYFCNAFAILLYLLISVGFLCEMNSRKSF